MKTVVYHSADYDGIFCREIARKFLGEEGVTYIGWNFGDPPLDPALLASPIVVMDLPLDAPFGLQFKDGWICKDGNQTQPFDRWETGNITWIDHHATAIASHPPTVPGYRIDGVSACRLAWQWFNWDKHAINPPGIHATGVSLPEKQHYLERLVNEPLAVRLAGEYDVWDHRGDGDLEFQFGLRTQPPNFGDLLDTTATADSHTQAIVNIGAFAMAYQKTVDENAVKHRSFLMVWEGRRFLCLNTAQCNSNTFKALDVPETGHAGLLAFYWNGRVWTVSLYHAAHRKEVDLSIIAKKYGGGGHKGACGFTCGTIPFPLFAH